MKKEDDLFEGLVSFKKPAQNLPLNHQKANSLNVQTAQAIGQSAAYGSKSTNYNGQSTQPMGQSYGMQPLSGLQNAQFTGQPGPTYVTQSSHYSTQQMNGMQFGMQSNSVHGRYGSQPVSNQSTWNANFNPNPTKTEFSDLGIVNNIQPKLSQTVQPSQPLAQAKPSQDPWKNDNWADFPSSANTKFGAPPNNTATGGDVFDLDFLDKMAQQPKLTSNVDNDNLLGLLSLPASASPKVDIFVQKQEVVPPPKPTRASKSDENTGNAMEDGIQALIKMGFDRKVATEALLEHNLNVELAVEALLTKPKIDDSNKDIEPLLKMGFKEQECRQAYIKANGDINVAIESLLHRRRRSVQFQEEEPKDAAQIAQKIGASVLNKAKDVFNFSKKKIEQVLDKSKVDSQQNYPAYSESEWNEWNSPTFKDDAPVSSEHMTTKGFDPAKFGMEREDSGDVVLTRKTTPVEQDLLNMNQKMNAASIRSPDLLQTKQNGITSTPPPKVEFRPPVVKNVVKEDVPVNPIIRDQAEGIRLEGNDLFKKGQFGDAEAKYTKAIDLLPPGSSLLIPLYNNRAGCRLKNGDYRGTLSDCDYVNNFEPNDIKCLLRRAMAYEALENWNSAREDYRTIMGIDPNVKGCSAGMARCTAALTPKNEQLAPKPVVPKGPMVSASVNVAVNEAVQKLRQANDTTDQLEAEKFKLHDKVNDKINQWKQNKETNLRALIASLDTVLWPELGWKTVNLGELVQTSQVKVKYMKAVAKVHPDKLGAGCSVEQQLIAAGVFSVLNKAWDSFKVANNM